jgi:hypothetical protein
MNAESRPQAAPDQHPTMVAEPPEAAWMYNVAADELRDAIGEPRRRAPTTILVPRPRPSLSPPAPTVRPRVRRPARSRQPRRGAARSGPDDDPPSSRSSPLLCRRTTR